MDKRKLAAEYERSLLHQGIDPARVEEIMTVYRELQNAPINVHPLQVILKLARRWGYGK